MIDNNGRYGSAHLSVNNVLTFHIGSDSYEEFMAEKFDICLKKPDLAGGHIVKVEGYNVLTRGSNDRQVETITKNIKENRLLPQLIEKQVKMMFGEGIYVYKTEFTDDGKLYRRWQRQDDIDGWLNSWNDHGITDDYQDFAISIVRRYYNFEDTFVKWRFAPVSVLGKRIVVGQEMVENSKARLATEKNLGFTKSSYDYDDFTHVVVGDWRRSGGFKVYPRFDFRHVNQYNVAISHHVNDDVDSLYGRNKSYEGSAEWIEAANENPRFIRSFLRNSLAAKMHCIIPNEWVESIRIKIKSLCQENKVREKDGKELFTINDIKIGTCFSESLVIEYTNRELRKLTEYLSGADNQGKLFSTFSYRTTSGESVEWKLLPLDLKYKEYIESLIAFDRRADEVLVESVGLDPSISNVSKEGVISKSGSDSYYNYIIYQNQLPAAEKICCDPLNMAIRVNFPELYREGFRVGFYRNVPQKQQDLSPDDRLKNQ